MEQSPHEERTFFMIKPDGVVRGLTGEIIQRVEQRGLKIIALKMFIPSREHIDGHYPKDPAWVMRLGEKTKGTFAKYNRDVKAELGTDDAATIGAEVRGWILDSMTAGPVVAMVVEGLHAIDMVRKLAGPTIPALAEVGTIRGDYSVDSPLLANLEKRAVANLVHASETPEEATHEIGYWFKSEELVQYERGFDPPLATRAN